jgi:hypothetical protein
MKIAKSAISVALFWSRLRALRRTRQPGWLPRRKRASPARCKRLPRPQPPQRRLARKWPLPRPGRHREAAHALGYSPRQRSGNRVLQLTLWERFQSEVYTEEEMTAVVQRNVQNQESWPRFSAPSCMRQAAVRGPTPNSSAFGL